MGCFHCGLTIIFSADKLIITLWLQQLSHARSSAIISLPLLSVPKVISFLLVPHLFLSLFSPPPTNPFLSIRPPLLLCVTPFLLFISFCSSFCPSSYSLPPSFFSPHFHTVSPSLLYFASSLPPPERGYQQVS